jgi:hypothetical protein
MRGLLGQRRTDRARGCIAANTTITPQWRSPGPVDGPGFLDAFAPVARIYGLFHSFSVE